MHHRLPLALVTTCLLAAAAIAAPQAPVKGGGREHRESRAESRAIGDRGGATKTWRRIAKDGTVVEEEGAPDPALERWLEELRGEAGRPERLLEDLRKELGGAGLGELPPGFGELPPGFGGLPPGFGELPKGETKSARSSHTRRVVVVNGETIVDEELRDGVPVRPSAGTPLPGLGGGGRALPGRAEARAEAHASSSSSSSASDSSASDGTRTGSSSDGKKSDGGGAKRHADGAKPALPDGIGRFPVRATMPVKPLAPRARAIEPKPAPARAGVSPASTGLR